MKCEYVLPYIRSKSKIMQNLQYKFPFHGIKVLSKLQALVYDILLSTTAVLSYAIWSRKLSANEQFSLGAQTVVSVLQATQIMSDVCFIIDHVAYAS